MSSLSLSSLKLGNHMKLETDRFIVKFIVMIIRMLFLCAAFYVGAYVGTSIDRIISAMP